MDFSFFKNPIILAILVGVVTYIYLWWDNKQKKEKNPKAILEEVDYIIPSLAALLTLFIAYNLFGNNTTNESVGPVINVEKPVLEGGGPTRLIENNKFSEKIAESFDSRTYHLLGKNTIKLPQTDVFIDIAKF